MLQNSTKDDIKNALERSGLRGNTHNVELVYQVLMGDKSKSIGEVIKELGSVMR